MKNPFDKLVLLSLLMLTACGQGFATADTEGIAASALFNHFETVFYAKSDLVFGSHAYNKLAELESATLRYPFALLPGALHSLGEWAAVEVFNGSDAVLVGARDFRAPQGSDNLGQCVRDFVTLSF